MPKSIKDFPVKMTITKEELVTRFRVFHKVVIDKATSDAYWIIAIEPGYVTLTPYKYIEQQFIESAGSKSVH